MIKTDNQLARRTNQRNYEMRTRPLTTRDLARFRAMLLEYREEVLDDLKEEQEILKSARAVDQGQGSWNLDFAGDSADTESSEHAVIQIRRLTATLEQLTAALNRLDSGTYGQCTRCGMFIEKERLEAIPFTRRCMNCKMVAEAA